MSERFVVTRPRTIVVSPRVAKRREAPGALVVVLEQQPIDDGRED